MNPQGYGRPRIEAAHLVAGPLMVGGGFYEQTRALPVLSGEAAARLSAIAFVSAPYLILAGLAAKVILRLAVPGFWR